MLVDHGYVVTMDASASRFEDGYVLVRDGVIDAVGHASDRPTEPVDVRLDAGGCVVVPGLINTHQHHWYNLFRGLGGGMLLEQWIENLLVPTATAMRPDDFAAASRLSCLEMLTTGTTTCLNHSVTVTGEREVGATLDPVLESGMRQFFGKEVRPKGLDTQLALAEDVYRRWHGAGDGRVTVGFVIEATAHWVALGTCSEELVMRGTELAGRLGTRISSHIAGGTMSRQQGYLRFVLETGRTDIEFLHQLGVLDDRWVLAHAIYPRERDVELIATSGATVAHTPTSESLRGAGIAPVRRYRDAGVGVALGSDGPMVDTSVDMVEQMKATMLLQNQLHRDATAVTPDDALRMATIDAARCLGMQDRIGSIEPGKRADLVAFDLDNPRCSPWHDPVAALVQSARGTDARHVLVDGEALVASGELARSDRAQVADVIGEARERARELLARTRVPANCDPASRPTLPSLV